MTAANLRSDMLSELSQCAYRLGLAFGHEAERAEDTARKLEYFRLFDRCFFAVRVAIGLELRLRRTSATAPGEAVAADEDLAERADPSEGERSERGREADRERDRDREREAEPASLPVLLRTLDGVVADAAALPGPEPAALPTLRELLTHVSSETPSTPAPPRADLRARLAGSATALTLQRATRPAGVPGGLAVRRATGPPRR